MTRLCPTCGGAKNIPNPEHIPNSTASQMYVLCKTCQGIGWVDENRGSRLAWECPRCGTINSPYVNKCDCNPKVREL